MAPFGKGAALLTQRLHGLDALRGLTLVSMILYHACWDIVWIFGANWPWYRSFGAYLWQQSICWTFILLSGYCFRLGRRPLRRGATVFLAGALVSAVTILFMPSNRVFFGVLSLLGASMLLTAALEPFLSRIPAAAGLPLSFALFLLCRRIPERAFGLLFTVPLPAALYRSDFTACFGFPPSGFFSTDYFPLLPWLFLFLCGYYLSGVIRRPPRFVMETRLPALNAMGRYSLWVYLLHQPIIYALLSLTFRRPH